VAIFVQSLGKEQRRATGAHFTSAVDIMKVVGPTNVAPWTEFSEAADTLGAAVKPALAEAVNRMSARLGPHG